MPTDDLALERMQLRHRHRDLESQVERIAERVYHYPNAVNQRQLIELRRDLEAVGTRLREVELEMSALAG